MILWLLLLILFVICCVLIVQYHWSRRRLYSFANSLPGPPTLPIIGNGLNFLGQTEDLLIAMEGTARGYPKPMRIWLGPILVVVFAEPDHLEKILTSKAIAHKHEIYDLMKVYVGESLITGSGRQSKRDKKLIQPLFNTKFMQSCATGFRENVELCMSILEGYVDRGTFDIHHLVHRCCADIISESFLGKNMNTQKGENTDYIKMTIDVYDMAYKRMLKPWLHPDLLYTLFGEMKKQKWAVKKIDEIFGSIVCEARMNVKSRKNDTPPIIEQVIKVYEDNSIPISNRELIHHALTLFLASEDTINGACSFLCMFLGMYPECQVLAANEIRSVFGDQVRPVEYDDLGRLQYIEMCIKEVFRLVPIAPYVLRKTTEDFEIDNQMTIPKECAVLISIYEVHKDKRHWERADDFYPDHFLPEAANKRHPYAYIPFSAGPRACIGQQFAVTAIKMLIANILQRFEIEADGKIGDLKLRADISVRSVNGYNVRLRRRVWT